MKTKLRQTAAKLQINEREYIEGDNDVMKDFKDSPDSETEEEETTYDSNEFV